MANAKVRIEEIKDAIKSLNNEDREILFNELFIEPDLRIYIEWRSEQIRLAEEYGGNDDVDWPDVDWEKEFRQS